MALAVLTFVLCLVLILGSYWYWIERPESEAAQVVARRIRRLSEPASPSADIVAEDVREVSAVPLLAAILRRNANLTAAADRLLVEADVKVTVGVFLAMCLAAGAVGWAAGLLVLKMVLPALALALLSATVPFLVINSRRQRRLHQFEEQFPEAIDLIARSLRAGHAFTTGLGIAADELPAPVGTEFKKVFDRQNFGMSLPEALRGMAARVPVLDARFFVTAVLTQRESGGNLAEILDNLSSVMRERFKVKRQIRVISAHARLSGWILSLVPPVLAFVLFTMQPSYLRLLAEDPIGVRLVIGAVCLQVLGMYLISRLVRIDY